MGNVNSGSVNHEEEIQEGAIKIKIVTPSFMGVLCDLDMVGMDFSNKIITEDQVKKRDGFVGMILNSFELLNLTSDSAVVIKPYVVQGEDFLRKTLDCVQIKKPLPKDTSRTDVVRIGQEIISVLRDPRLVGQMLKDLEEIIMDDMQKKVLAFQKATFLTALFLLIVDI